MLTMWGAGLAPGREQACGDVMGIRCEDVLAEQEKLCEFCCVPLSATSVLTMAGWNI